MHTAADFIRIAVAAGVGCGLYDTVMYATARALHKRHARQMAAQVDAMTRRYEELQAQAEAKKA